MEIKKIENCDYVMFPRMQHRGLVFKHVERDAFKAELRHVPGHGDYWLLHQQSKPHLVAHVQLPKSEAEFDNILGWCLGQNKWCEYIEGDLSFLCVIAGQANKFESSRSKKLQKNLVFCSLIRIFAPENSSRNLSLTVTKIINDEKNIIFTTFGVSFNNAICPTL